MSTIFPLSQTFPLVTSDFTYTTEFKRYLDQILARIGGVSGGSYTQLAAVGGIIAWDLDKAPIAVTVLTTNVTIPNPTNQVAGFLYPYRITLVQDGTGGRTVTWGSAFKFPSGTPPTLSTGANAVDELWFSSDGTNLKLCVLSRDLR